MKEAKRHRDRQRRKRKLEYNSATSIQKVFRGWLLRKKQQSANVISSFLG
jgi:hypothetical protein